MTTLSASPQLATAGGQLAVAGGTPVSGPLTPPPWPPVNEATARRLAELYLSRAWSFNGPEEQAFAQEFAAYHGAAHGVFMANGTVTLQCALGVYGIGADDEVIIPALTWPATAMAVLYVGATPVFVDIEPTTLCIDAAQVEAAITPRTRAIIPVHLYGGNADLDAILAVAARHNLVVVEDCAHAQGGKWNGRGLGSWGDVGSFSFQQSKTIASGEGGICLTNDAAMAERLYRMKHIGYAPGSVQGLAAAGPPPDLMCHNFRATDFQALILRDQLRGLESLIDLYNRNAARLTARLAEVDGVRVQSRGRLAEPQSYYAWGVIFDGERFDGIAIDTIREAIAAEGLPIGRTYGTVYRHPLFTLPGERYRIADGSCPVAENIGADRTLVLLHPWLGSDDAAIDLMGDIIAKVATNPDQLQSNG